MGALRKFLVAVVTATLWLPSVASATCGAEGCPCVRRGLADNSGRFAFDARFLDVSQDQLWSGSGPATLADLISTAHAHGTVELYTRTRSWMFESRVRVSDRLQLSASLPYLEREHRHYRAHVPFFVPSLVEQWHYEGLGDAVVLGQYSAIRPLSGPRVTLQGGVKLPTGRRHVPGPLGTEPEPVLRPGSGSTDGLAGIGMSQALPWQPVLPLSLNLLKRWNGVGTEGYRAGDELQASVSTGWAVRPWATLTALANFSSHASDSWQASGSDPFQEPAHAGGQALFVTPGASVSVRSGVTLYAVWQNRVWGHTNQPMAVARNYFMIGSSFSLGM